LLERFQLRSVALSSRRIGPVRDTVWDTRILAGMICPHCRTAFTASWQYWPVGSDSDGDWQVGKTRCAHETCRKWIVQFGRVDPRYSRLDEESAQPVRPMAAARPVPSEVPNAYAADFTEAVVTLPDSPKASAALSRRCLQSLIREEAGITRPTLSQEIDDLIGSGKLPSWLAENVDAIRNVGNFSAHPTKDQHTGEIVEVEAGEAEWLLDVLEGLFDFYFVQPAAAKRRRDNLNQKLQRAGKPPVK
jgi:hypothetical protein